MIPLRLGDSVRVIEMSFAGATGFVRDFMPDMDVALVELETFGVKVRRGLVLPFSTEELEATSCQHPSISESDLLTYMSRRWADIEPPHCPDCTEWLYPDDSEGLIRIYVGEPKGAGAELGAW